jgi:hypothetical protein
MEFYFERAVKFKFKKYDILIFNILILNIYNLFIFNDTQFHYNENLQKIN